MKRLMIVLLVALFSQSLFAQDAIQLSVSEACKFALENNRTIKNSQLNIDKSHQAIREAIANGLPQINGSIDYTNALGAEMSIKFSELAPETTIPIKPTSNLYLTFSQLIFSGSYIVGIQTAKIAKELAEINYDKSELDIQNQVIETYYLHQVSMKIKSLLEANVENLEDLYTKTKALADVGVIESTNVDQLGIQVNALKNSVSSTERQVEMAANMLKLQLGVSMDSELVLTESLESLLSDAVEPNLLLRNLDLSSNFDFQLMNKQESITRKMIDMEYAGALPTISAFYRYTEKILKPDFDMTPQNTLGLQMNIPIFSSGMRIYKINQAKIDLETVQNNKALVADQLRMQERQLKFNYNSAVEKYNNQLENIEVSRRVYQNLKFKFEQGMISGLDLIDADSNYLRAETDLISAGLEVLNSKLQLQKLYGNVGVEMPQQNQ